MPAPLSTPLFRAVRPEFFRVLSGPLARLYVDALDALEAEASQRDDGLDREEAIALVEQALETHPNLVPDPDDPLAKAASLREKANTVLETLRRAGWVSREDNRTDYRRVIAFEPDGSVLLQAIRRVAYPEAAVFSDKLINVCNTLANRSALLDQPWPQVESCLVLLQAGLAELRGMQKSIERQTRDQLTSATLKENLFLLFDQFSERIGRTCYAQLVHARLPARLAEARAAVDELGRPDLLEAMQREVLRRDPELSLEAAAARVRVRLGELSEWLDKVEPLAAIIDRRTAEFTRRSHARSRYLQESTSENRATVQTFFETLNRHFEGRRVSEIEDTGLEVPGLRLAEIRLPGGLESLYTPRLRPAAGEIAPLGDTDTRQQDRTLAQLESNLRDSLTVGRANRFVAALSLESGASLSSERLVADHIHNDEDLAGLIACLLHARAADARYRIELPRETTGADRPVFDTKLGYRIERFILAKK